MQALRSHQHNLSPIRDLRLAQCDGIRQNPPCANRNDQEAISIPALVPLEIYRVSLLVKREKTFENELLSSNEDIGKRLEKRLEVLYGRVRRKRNRYRSSTELDVHCYGGRFLPIENAIACTAALHFFFREGKKKIFLAALSSWP